MQFNKAMIQEKMQSWGEALRGYSLPQWEALPTLPLYMDQVIFLLNQYLTLLPGEENADKLVTPAMINNYVKLKIIPAPIKKRYGRTHLAYLVMVCVLKQTLNTSEIRKLLPLDVSEAEIQALYTAFARTHLELAEYFIDQVRKAAAPIFQQEEASVTHLVFQTAIAANLSKLLAERIILLHPENAEDASGK